MTQTRKMSFKTPRKPLILPEMRPFTSQKRLKFAQIPGAVTFYRGDLCQKKFTVKELDSETGLYYYGARYLDPKTSRWLSGDPALGEYLPSAPVNEEAKKRNGSLPGQGGRVQLR